MRCWLRHRKPTIDERADHLEELRKLEHAGDGMVDDMMLSGEITEMFEKALMIHKLEGDALAVMRLRIRMAAIDAVDLVAEDFRRRGQLA